MSQLSSLQLIWSIVIMWIGFWGIATIVFAVSITRETVKISKEKKESHNTGGVA